MKNRYKNILENYFEKLNLANIEDHDLSNPKMLSHGYLKIDNLTIYYLLGNDYIIFKRNRQLKALNSCLSWKVFNFLKFKDKVKSYCRNNFNRGVIFKF
jgi:hypothetical protein